MPSTAEDSFLEHWCFFSSGSCLFIFWQVFRFQVLVALMLSSQTKDQITSEAMSKLKSRGCSIDSFIGLSEDELGQLIYPVGFWRVMLFDFKISVLCIFKIFFFHLVSSLFIHKVSINYDNFSIVFVLLHKKVPLRLWRAYMNRGGCQMSSHMTPKPFDQKWSLELQANSWS